MECVQQYIEQFKKQTSAKYDVLASTNRLINKYKLRMKSVALHTSLFTLGSLCSYSGHTTHIPDFLLGQELKHLTGV